MKYLRSENTCTVPLWQNLAEAIRGHRSGKLPQTRAFGGRYAKLTDNTADMLRGDLWGALRYKRAILRACRRKQKPRSYYGKRGFHARPKGLEPSTFGSTVRCKPASEGQKRGKPDQLVSGLFFESEIGADLRIVIETWPRLSDDIRAAILRIVGQ